MPTELNDAIASAMGMVPCPHWTWVSMGRAGGYWQSHCLHDNGACFREGHPPAYSSIQSRVLKLKDFHPLKVTITLFADQTLGGWLKGVKGESVAFISDCPDEADALAKLYLLALQRGALPVKWTEANLIRPEYRHRMQAEGWSEQQLQTVLAIEREYHPPAWAGNADTKICIVHTDQVKRFQKWLLDAKTRYEATVPNGAAKFEEFLQTKAESREWSGWEGAPLVWAIPD